MISAAAGNKSRETVEQRLFNNELDFSGAYMAAKDIGGYIRNIPGSLTDRTVGALIHLITSDRFDRQSRVFFLFREAADILAGFALSEDEKFAPCIIHNMQEILIKSSGHRHRAVSEALGRLALTPSVPHPAPCGTGVAEIEFSTLADRLGLEDPGDVTWVGRSLAGKRDETTTGVIKFARAGEDTLNLINETAWMACLRENFSFGTFRFDIPEPVHHGGSTLFKVTALPPALHTNTGALHEDAYAIAYRVHKDYFTYPNMGGYCHHWSVQEIREVFQRCAWLTGRLASMGVIHTALIPLFHNRVQQARREDSGVYRWEHGGRLDRWLESCRYPNMALSGLRDFEHFAAAGDLSDIRHHIGSHLLSFVLMAGSFFRNLAPEKYGTDENGSPADTRYLFDPVLFENLLKDAVKAYYKGFVGTPFPERYDLSFKALTERLISRMGVDSHMEEVLRVDDQHRMDEKSFFCFLSSRGLPEERIREFKQGKQEITLHTGPHLGGFNQGISLPELIDFLLTASALIISDKYTTTLGGNGARSGTG